MDDRELRKVIWDGLDQTLGKVYEMENIDTGAITPMQNLEWDNIVDKTSKLFTELIEQNRIEDLEQKKFKNEGENMKNEKLTSFTEEEFQKAFQLIYQDAIAKAVPKEQKCVIFLGGQPGSGKSQFYKQDDSLRNYIVIDGDTYRKYHPNHELIKQQPIQDYAELTQPFVNRCVERMIDRLSDDSYNIIIEGTLRNPDTTINTCNKLKDKGYNTSLYIVAVSAVEAWNSTINRSKLLEEMHEVPREVPFEKYDYIVHNLPSSVDKIEKTKCFDDLYIVDRNYHILYPNHFYSASEVMEQSLRLGEWERTKCRTVRIEEVSRETGKIGRGQTLYTNKTEKELRDWFHPETEKTSIRVTELDDDSVMNHKNNKRRKGR